MSSAASKTLALVGKDLRTEIRGRDTLVPMTVFALTVILLLAFAVPDPGSARSTGAPAGTVEVRTVLAAFLWVTVLFAGLIGAARSFEVEREEGALDPLLLAPLDRSAQFAAKATSNLIFVACLQVVIVPLAGLLFGLSLGLHWLAFAGVVVMVDAGFVCIATLISSIAALTRSRELVLPVLALPLLVPLFLAGVELTADLFAGDGFAAVSARGWFGILLAYDIVVATGAALVYEYAVDA